MYTISQPLESSIGGSGELFCGRNSCLARGMQSLEDGLLRPFRLEQ